MCQINEKMRNGSYYYHTNGYGKQDSSNIKDQHAFEPANLEAPETQWVKVPQ